MRVAVRWAGEELRRALGELTSQQARGVVRIVVAELEGRSIGELLDCENQICASTTFYRRGGWKDNGRFQRALTLARGDYRTWMLENGAEEALSILAETAPEAARALRQRVRGDNSALAVLEATLAATEPALRVNAARQLGETGLPQVVPGLRAALHRERNAEAKAAMVEALGRIASGAARDQDAAESVLDRADIKTAAKGLRALTGGEGGPVELGIVGVVGSLSDEEVDAMLGNLIESVKRET